MLRQSILAACLALGLLAASGAAPHHGPKRPVPKSVLKRPRPHSIPPHIGRRSKFRHWHKWRHGRTPPIVRGGWPSARWFLGYGWYSFPPEAFAVGRCYAYRYSRVTGWRWIKVPVPGWYVPPDESGL